MRSFGSALESHTPFGGSDSMMVSVERLTELPAPFSLLHLLASVPLLISECDKLFRLSSCPPPRQILCSLTHRCQRTDEGICRWLQLTPGGPWQGTIHQDARIPEDGLHNRADYYSDVSTARSFDYARVARMFLHVILLQCARIDQSMTASHPSEHQCIILNMADDIYASVPCHLGQCVGYEWSGTFTQAFCQMDVITH